jgi:DNA end-binding protein Ku
VLAIHTLLWPDEVRDTSELKGAAMAVELSDKEVDLAGKIIDLYAEDFNPAKYTDTFAQRKAELFATKAAGDEFHTVEPDGDDAAGEAEVSDLLAKLQASVKAREAAKEAELDAAVARHPAKGAKGKKKTA